MKFYKTFLFLVLALTLFSCTSSSDYVSFDERVNFDGDYWNSLIDDRLNISGNAEYTNTLSYSWHDEKCDLRGEVFEPYPGGYWQGAAISNYCSKDLQSDGNEYRQLCAYVEKPFSGNNFLICNGFMDGVVELRFDSKRSYIGSMMVANTTYLYNVAMNGNHITPALGKNESIWVEANGYHNGSDEVQATAEFYLFKNGKPAFEGWKKWYLTSMCKVDRIVLSVKWNGVGEWMPYPAYFALDDIQVARQEPLTKKE